MAYSNLKTLIKALRAAKTLADERSLIAQESAAIRTAFKEDDAYSRHHNIAKLLYIHMLGYPAHFGQIECLKLVASPRFTDKRLGYLGTMLLLDENQEVLTLVTNSLKNDMNHSNMYAVGLALSTFANISSEEMSRDLCNEVEKLLGSSNTYIRKKAALCALRIVRRVPDLIDHFISKARSLIQDRNHGVLLSGVTLVIEMCQSDEECKNEFRKAVPLLVKHLKSLTTVGYSPEHDVSGVTDPFLQVKILRLLRLLGRGDAKASEDMNDILAQVATNTDGSKNVGNAILYETVLAVLEIEADSGLRVMAINILGKFLSNRDNNIRYVALNTLNKVVTIDTSSVQRHRPIILDCLRDGDISIRRRALELCYALTNEQNVRIMVRELLAFLEVADAEFKLGMTTEIALAAERFAPNKRWHIDTVLRVLKLAGNFVREEILSAFIRLVCHTPELQTYTVQKLYLALLSDISQESLTLASVWLIGEFGDVLLKGWRAEEGEEVKHVSQSDIIDLLNSVLNSPYTNTLSSQFVLTALVKLSARFAEDTPGSDQIGRIARLLNGYDHIQDLELQQRSVEYGSLLQASEIMHGVLERMPPPEIKATIMGGTASERRSVGSTQTTKDTSTVLDLLGDDVSESADPSGQPSSSQPSASVQNTHDLLADIFGSGSAAPANGASTVSSAQPASTRSAVDDIMGLFGNSSSATSTPSTASTLPPNVSGSLFDTTAPAPTPALAPAPPKPTAPAQGPQSYTAYEKNGLKITLTPRASPTQQGVIQILARFTALDGVTIQGVNFQAAVPRTQQLQMLAMSNADVAPGSIETQQMRIMAPVGSQVRLRLRISFQREGQPIQDQTDFAGFPANLTSGGQ
ncbi:adaptor protein complex ap-1 gamma subunit [Phaffia rhodozyma]|uniref:AP-1 complex subunit gamma n=1 Tax=Phaffia rhodozyma TaxID=264483 RepID=A0A0F7SW99_PHARH|nr:adaptor protein complex ap-1 gamma subunit [Phaffia rhodozyma]